MLGFISFIVVFVVLSATVFLIFVTLDNASDAIAVALKADVRRPVAPVYARLRNTRQVVVTRPAFAPLRVAA